MDIHLNRSLIAHYRSNTQIARVLTETWLGQNMYCPHCGNPKLKHCKNNLPVEDFYCPVCGNEYELKSKNGNIGNKVNDGAYETMISRITSKKNPDFFFLSYSRMDLIVKNLILIPKYFFYPEIIEKRKPLASTARRAGWVGCNILLREVPQQGRIPIITNGIIKKKELVIEYTQNSTKLNNSTVSNRGWQMDVLNCVNMIENSEFNLNEIYQFEKLLQAKYPNNHHIKEKIRQQLQLLRDKGVIKFLSPGHYKKIL